MIVKRCDYCGKIIPVGKKCGCIRREQYKASAADKYSDVRDFYKTVEWEKARRKCIERCFGIDLYSYYVLHRIDFGQTVHHIVPLTEGYDLRTKQSNLIYLTESNHRLIHELYKTEYKDTAELLKGLLCRFLQAQK